MDIVDLEAASAAAAAVPTDVGKDEPDFSPLPEIKKPEPLVVSPSKKSTGKKEKEKKDKAKDKKDKKEKEKKEKNEKDKGE